MTAIRPCIISTARSRRRADRGGRAERRRQVDAVQGRGRRHQAARRPHRAQRRCAAGHRLPAADRRDRPHASRSTSTTSWRWGCGAARACSAASAAGTATRSSRRIAAVGLTGFEQRPIGTLSGGQMQRMLFARLLLAGRPRHRARRAVQRHRRQDLLGPDRADPALARREAHRSSTRAARPRAGQGAFPRDAAARPRAGGLGQDRRGADARQLGEGAAHVRGLRRSGAAPARSRRRSSCPCSTTRLIGPFLEFEFMRRALVATFALALGAAPIGVILMLRRMSLDGRCDVARDPARRRGGLPAGGAQSVRHGGRRAASRASSSWSAPASIARSTELKEDASLAAFFLISLALGVTLVSMKGTNIDLLHFLFGSVLAVDDPALLLVVGIASVSLVVLALIWRPLVLECVDPDFLRSVSRAGAPAHHGVPGAGGDEPGRRLPGARHACSRSAS